MKIYDYFFKRIISIVVLIPAFILISGVLNAQNNKSIKEPAMQYFKCIYVEKKTMI